MSVTRHRRYFNVLEIRRDGDSWPLITGMEMMEFPGLSKWLRGHKRAAFSINTDAATVMTEAAVIYAVIE